ncbi:putative microtubule associated protein [Golovinomyces cichoracearum]|uniref:Putative microtubule associated protein n=1 Tax=Golovinomyces cichoracearum TaxID=62708 RepID=A0A420IIM0_9PEZI|nr:putative microtubule associated protein [Golovinomyces cichoracearum]
MVQNGFEDLDTPRTKFEDATYMTKDFPEFDISEDQSFQVSLKENNNPAHRPKEIRRDRPDLRTPLARPALKDRRNVPGFGGGEFTPLLRNATRRSALRNLQENSTETPAFLKQGGLNNNSEDLSPLPVSNSIYGDISSGTYLAETPAPQFNSNSIASTPETLQPNKKESLDILQDGGKLSLREQENAIDRIEKENFALKLRIHFLENAQSKFGPEFNEQAIKENTELKVDKVTMQREINQFRKTLHAAQQDVETYKQQLTELQENSKRTYIDDRQREELNNLHQTLENKEEELNQLRNQRNQGENSQEKISKLEANLKEKERHLGSQEKEIIYLKEEAGMREAQLRELEAITEEAKLRITDLEEKAEAYEELERAKGSIQIMESKLKELRAEVESAQHDRQDALRERDRTESDLKELQEEMANKSFNTKDLYSKMEERARHTQDELQKLRKQYSLLQDQYQEKIEESHELQAEIHELKLNNQITQQKHKDKLLLLIKEKDFAIRERDSIASSYQSRQNELHVVLDEKNTLQIHNETIKNENTSLQRDLERCRKRLKELEESLELERSSALRNEQELSDEHQNEVNSLKNKIEDVQAQLEEKERSYRRDIEEWNNERKTLLTQRDISEEKVNSLQKTIDKLHEAGGTLSSKEAKLQQALKIESDRHHDQEAFLHRQVNDLNEDVQARQQAFAEAQLELTSIREELRLNQRDQKTLEDKVEALEDEVEVLQTNLDEETESFNKEITTARKESERLMMQISSIKSDLTKAEAMALNAQAEIEEYRTNLQRGEDSKDDLQSRIKDLEKQINFCRQEKNSLQDQLNQVNSEVQSLRNSIADLEAERTELNNLLNDSQKQKVLPHNDEERINLRSSKLKLENEVRRLQEENRVAVAGREAAENSLDREIAKANNEEIRLTNEILDLQQRLKGTCDKRELTAAKNLVLQLEARVKSLESHGGEFGDEDEREISLINRNLREARKKESEYIQREASQKSIIRDLKRKIADLERQVHNTEISYLKKNPPNSPSVDDSILKEELAQLRAQLTDAHKTLKELRAQLKKAEKESHYRLVTTNTDLEARIEALEAEKDKLYRSLNQVESAKEQLLSKNSTADATVNRLKAKIQRLENALRDERLNSGENRTIALERKDLHEMLRESQSQAESLEFIIQERDDKISGLKDIEKELRRQLNQLREEQTKSNQKSSLYHDQLERLQQKFHHAKDQWESERKQLTRGVRFANMSLSMTDDSPKHHLKQQNQQEIKISKTEFEEYEKRHKKEMRGVSLQLEWLRAKCSREEFFRAEAAFAKRFMALQIALFQACNKADIELLEKYGIPRPPPRPKRRISVKRIGIVIRAIIRMKRAAGFWAEKQKIDEKIQAQIERQSKIQTKELSLRCSNEAPSSSVKRKK